MPVKDAYTLNLKDANILDKISDKFLGTNKVNNIQTMNNYELQKSLNINKYGWNVEGMKQNGINPIIGSANLANVSSVSTSYQSNKDLGVINNLINDNILNLLNMLSPSKREQKAKQILDLIK